jgi:hypothetical protein
MKIFLFLVLFVLALFGIPMVWFLAEVLIESGVEELIPIINAVRNYKVNGHTVEYYINAIIFYDEPKINRLYWDYKTKTMYGMPIMEITQG